MTTLIQQHNGKVLDSSGDNLLAEFANVVDSVQCAVAVQKIFQGRKEEMNYEEIYNNHTYIVIDGLYDRQ